VALDSSWFERHHVSRYFEKRCYQNRRKFNPKFRPIPANRRRSRTAKQLPKLSPAIHAASHLIVAAQASTGLGTDHTHFAPLLLCACCRMRPRRMRPRVVVADAGFDSEANHRLAREVLKVRSLIPARRGWTWNREPTAHYRRLMSRRLKPGLADHRHYCQRWQIETVNSMLKRNLTSACRSRTTWGRKRDLLIRAVTHNLMIVANL
jgi:Transposase DDE domain